MIGKTIGLVAKLYILRQKTALKICPTFAGTRSINLFNYYHIFRALYYNLYKLVALPLKRLLRYSYFFKILTIVIIELNHLLLTRQRFKVLFYMKMNIKYYRAVMLKG